MQLGATAISVLLVVVLLSLAVPLLLAGQRRVRNADAMTTGVGNLSLALLLSSTFFGDLTTLTVLT